MTLGTVIHGLIPAILGLGLNESAYLAEIFRAGLKSVDQGQMRPPRPWA